MSAKKTAALLTVRQVRSGIGRTQRQRKTLRALGLGRIGHQRQLPDNREVRGMLSKVSHLVEVVAEEATS